MTHIPLHIAKLLDQRAAAVNTPQFIPHDPVQFPRLFSALPDIEITALLCATIAWGNRTMIIRNCNKLLDIMGREPAKYVLSGEFETLDDSLNIHRTFFARSLKHFLRGLRLIYSRHQSLQSFISTTAIPHSEAPGWELAKILNTILSDTNAGIPDSRCLPLNTDTTPLKRLHMALRWLVRRDGIVDLGVWSILSPAQLFIPLDVHVANTARNLKIIDRKSNDRKTVHLLTEALRELRPEDPVLYDYALFDLDLNPNP